MQLFSRRVFGPVAIVAATLSLSVCGGSGTKSGTATGPTVPVIPSPTPPVALTPVPVSSSCERLPLGSEKYSCRDESPSFMVEVNDAIDQLMREHPEYFSGDTVRNLGGYYVGIIKILDSKNICAAFDGEELAVKNSNDFSDQYKLITSWNQVRRFYIGTCYPALFPLSRSPAASVPGRLQPPAQLGDRVRQARSPVHGRRRGRDRPGAQAEAGAVQLRRPRPRHRLAGRDRHGRRTRTR